MWPDGHIYIPRSRYPRAPRYVLINCFGQSIAYCATSQPSHLQVCNVALARLLAVLASIARLQRQAEDCDANDISAGRKTTEAETSKTEA